MCRERTCRALTLQYRKPAKQATTSMYFLALAISIFSVDTMPADDRPHTAIALVLSWSSRMKLGVGMKVTHTCGHTQDARVQAFLPVLGDKCNPNNVCSQNNV